MLFVMISTNYAFDVFGTPAYTYGPKDRHNPTYPWPESPAIIWISLAQLYWHDILSYILGSTKNREIKSKFKPNILCLKYKLPSFIPCLLWSALSWSHGDQARSQRGLIGFMSWESDNAASIGCIHYSHQIKNPVSKAS